MGIPDHLPCLLRNLYSDQEATVRTGHGTTNWLQIGKGVHQGCILSPAYLTYMQRTSWEMLGWMKHKLESRLQGDQKSSPSLSLLSHSSLTVGARGRVYKHETTSLALECSSWLTRTGRTLHCPQPTFDLILQISRMNEFMPLQWFKVI